jgi:chromosome segregation ATPase
MKKRLGYARFVAVMMLLVALMVCLEGFVHWALTLALTAAVIGLIVRTKRENLDREENRRLMLEDANRQADTRRDQRLKVESEHAAKVRELEALVASIRAGHAPALSGLELLLEDKERAIGQLRATLAEIGKEDATFGAWHQAMEDQKTSFEAERAALRDGAKSAAEIAAAEIEALRERIRHLEAAKTTNGHSVDHAAAEMTDQQSN